jgi:hypothetical protein
MLEMPLKVAGRLSAHGAWQHLAAPSGKNKMLLVFVNYPN